MSAGNVLGWPDRGRIAPALLLAAASAGLLFFLRSASEVFIPFAVALVVALAAHPVVDWLARRKIPRWLSVLALVLVSLVVLAVVALLVQQGIQDFVQDLPKFKDRAAELVTKLSRRFGVAAPSLETLGSDPSAFKTIAGAGGSTALSLANLIFQLLLVILYSIFLLLGRQHLPGLARRALGKERARSLLEAVGKIEQELLRYLFLRGAVSLVTAVAVGVLLALYGVRFAGLWALLTFFAQFIPFVGPIALSLLPVLVAVVQFPSVSTAAWIALWLSLWHLFVGFVVEPRVFSIGLSLNQTIVLLGLALLGWMWGIVGALLWVPLMVALRLGARQIPGLEAVDLLLGPAHAARKDDA